MAAILRTMIENENVRIARNAEWAAIDEVTAWQQYNAFEASVDATIAQLKAERSAARKSIDAARKAEADRIAKLQKQAEQERIARRQLIAARIRVFAICGTPIALAVASLIINLH